MAAGALALVGLLGGFGAAESWGQSPEQAANAPPAGSAPAKPRTAGTETGFATFQTKCMSCHGNPNVPRAPQPSAIRQMSPERIYEALTSGPMKSQGDALSDDQRKMVAIFMSGRPFGTLQRGDASQMPNRCASNPEIGAPDAARDWNGWGGNPSNDRFKTASGLTAADASRLKLKWAFGYPGGLSAFGQLTVVAGRVFVDADTGYVYSLDARTGCVYWSFQAKGTVRSAVRIAPVKGVDGVRLGVFFGDFHANVYGLDAQTGRQLWTTRVSDHFVARITAGLAAYGGKLFVPVSSSEEFTAASLDYPCCTNRGSVVALDAATGRRLWTAWVVDKPRPTRKNSKGVQQYAPSGGSVWNSPTVDPRRGAIYFGTGDAETDPAPRTTDAILAVDIKTGRRLWSYQATANDSFLGGCSGAQRTDNCPKVNGPDLDIGNSPVLQSLPGGRRVLLAGTKDGHVFALDPDHGGKLLWKVNVLPKGARSSGGIYWGGAADGAKAYYGLAAGAMAAVDLKSGKRAWYQVLSKPNVSNSAATTAIPGVAFEGGMDGVLHALSTATGKQLWSFDTARPFETVNKVEAHGGGLGSAGPTVADGMLFVGSGYAVVGDKTGNVLLAFAPE
jgi:polyvinyl alcohol dehydrogenase (cytochrome)